MKWGLEHKLQYQYRYSDTEKNTVYMLLVMI
jgi:hypothetical protein